MVEDSWLFMTEGSGAGCARTILAFTAQKLKLDRAKHQPVVACASSMASQPTVVSSFV